MQSALTPSADSAARDYYAREKYRSRLCLGGVSLGLAVLGCCAALLPGFQSARRYPGHRPVCAGLLALLAAASSGAAAGWTAACSGCVRCWCSSSIPAAATAC